MMEEIRNWWKELMQVTDSKDQISLGSGNKLIYVVDLDEPDSVYEKNKLAKMDDMAQFIWHVQHRVLFECHEMTGSEVIARLVEMLDEYNIKSDELTY